jgi:hypothetical protein
MAETAGEIAVVGNFNVNFFKFFQKAASLLSPAEHSASLHHCPASLIP